MPRALFVSNGRGYANFPPQYGIGDLTWPHVGQREHTLGCTWRFGVWADGQFAWSGDDFQRTLNYLPDTLVTDVTLENRGRLDLKLVCNDAFHYHRDILIRKITVQNLRQTAREVRLFFHHDPYISGCQDGNTVRFRSTERSLEIFRDDITMLANVMMGDKVGFDSYCCGKKNVMGPEGFWLHGTWKDAEDGILGQASVSNGSVDCTGSVHFRLDANATQTIYYWIAMGSDLDAVLELEESLIASKPEQMLAETEHYWRYWLNKHNRDLGEVEQALGHVPNSSTAVLPGKSFADLGEYATVLYRRSVLTLRAYFNANGSIVAGIDGDFRHFSQDTYAYFWPRDGAVCGMALDVAGYHELPRKMFEFWSRIASREGYVHHKHYPSGTRASSWHPTVGPSGESVLPIQEDETALMLVSLWNHLRISRTTEVIYEGDALFRTVLQAARFLCSFVDDRTGLPKPSYDLWEERYGVHAFTAASVYSGLKSAARMARAVGDNSADHFDEVAERIKAAVEKHLFHHALGRFVRTAYVQQDGKIHLDLNIDASMFGLWYFGMFDSTDPRIVSTMEAIANRLWVKTPIGGIARNEGDYYHSVTNDVQNVPGNPWIITTLWQAQWHIHKARSLAELAPAKEIIEWTMKKASSAGLFPEQVDPLNGAPISVAPLMWSHATFVLAVKQYHAKFLELTEGRASD